MILPIAGFLICSALAMLFALPVYRRVWIAVRGQAITPTGSGVLLGPCLLGAALLFDSPHHTVVAFAIVAVLGAIYWVDDFSGLSARLRLALSFLAGFAILVSTFAVREMTWSQVLLFGALAGVLNVILTNIVNFYDGADLNLAAMIGLEALFILMFVPFSAHIWPWALACVAFVVPFASMNCRPKTIYMGDAGSFIFACLGTLLAVTYASRNDIPAEIAVPFALPAFDTFYVFCIRLWERHDLLSRNYLHLYQRLNARFSGFYYLIPQLLNAVAVSALAYSFQAKGLSNLVAVLLACAIATPLLYFPIRRLLLPTREKGALM